MAVREIPCPDCGVSEHVRKVDLGQYHCEECGRTFTREDLLSS